MGNSTLALQYWKLSLEMNPKQSRPWANILTLLDSEGKADEILKTSKVALKYVPNDPSLLFIRANAFGKLDKFIESEKTFKKAIKYQPNFGLFHLNLGVLYHRWNKTDLAIECYKTALKLDPSLPNAKKYLEQLSKKREQSES